MRSLFHLAYHVNDLDTARGFYGGILGCEEGRSTDTWVDFDFFGHQISLHLGKPFETTNTGKVGDHMVPMPHLGVILPLEDWNILAERLKGQRLISSCHLWCGSRGNPANNGQCSSATRQAIPSKSKALPISPASTPNSPSWNSSHRT
jgi:extradiol dioxygenase family protein